MPTNISKFTAIALILLSSLAMPSCKGKGGDNANNTTNTNTSSGNTAKAAGGLATAAPLSEAELKKQTDYRSIEDAQAVAKDKVYILTLYSQKPTAEDLVKIAEFVNLQKLTISNCAVDKFPDQIFNLNNLEFLDISTNNKLGTVPEGVARLTNLKVLGLNATGLTALPDNLAALTKLERLIISSNKLGTLPAFVTKMTNLRDINLSGCSLTTIPADLAKLTNLESLNLYGNPITELPAELGNLTKLKLLNITSTQIASVPETFGNLSSLETFFISSTQIKTLPESLAKLPKLITISLENNPQGDYAQFCTILAQIPTLKRLDMPFLKGRSSKENVTLPKELKLLTQIEVLDIRGNLLANPDAELASIKGLTQLKDLYINNCGLKTVPSFVFTFSGLKTLELINADIKTMPKDISKLSNLLFLKLHKNFPEAARAAIKTANPKVNVTYMD
jgi:Leucine-rich repeat (LRR) protein